LKAMGFNIMENFNLPYISKNFTDFWRRWHISLSTFIKEYLYIPLGGNRCGKFQQYFNLIFCFLVSGLWHGANWTFVLWGVYHGVFLTLDKALNLKPQTKRMIPDFVQIFVTFFLIMISWTIFRSENFGQFLTFIKAMASAGSNTFSSSWAFSNDVWFWLSFGLVASFIPATNIYSKVINKINEYLYLKFFSFLLLFILVIGKIAAATNVTFIYFRF